MFELTQAHVHYGLSSYDLHGLPSKYDVINGIEDLDLEDLKFDVGRLTSFPRTFTVKHVERQVIPGDKTVSGQDLVIEEHIFAHANGYSLTWTRRQ